MKSEHYELEYFVKAFGIFFLALIVIGVPLLCGLSFALGWDILIRLILCTVTFIIFVFVVNDLGRKVGMEEYK